MAPDRVLITLRRSRPQRAAADATIELIDGTDPVSEQIDPTRDRGFGSPAKFFQAKPRNSKEEGLGFPVLWHKRHKPYCPR